MADKRDKASWRTALAVWRIGLLPAVVLTLVGLAVAGVVVWGLFTRLLRGDWPWQVGGLDESTPGKDTTQIVLTVIAGLGAAVALVVAYRRQRDLELARFDERFAAAAAQLGAPTAAERLAGVYATAALADTWEQHRQQCIDVLCGYLRLPYDPTNTLLTTVVSEHTWPIGAATGKETRTYEQLPNDRQVRLTIISTITRHLRAPADGGAPTSWQGHDLDFTGATFDGGDFSHATFSGGRITFDGAQFTTGLVTFDEATFSGGQVTFTAASFSGGQVTFDHAQFAGGTVSFGAMFTRGGQVTFYVAEFTGGGVSFDLAEFIGGQVRFDGAQFDSGRLTFDYAQFSGGKVTFHKVGFTGGTVTFNEAGFTGGQVDFSGATFTGGQVTFNEPHFTSWRVTRDGVDFTGWPLPGPSPEPHEQAAG